MSVLENLINLYAPHACIGCGFEGSLLCDDCERQLDPATECCYRCQIPRRLGRTCVDCREQSPLVSVNCFTSYSNQIAKDLLWALKFNRAKAAAQIIALQIADMYQEVTPSDALIVPVPTAAKRVRSRGYDQAVLIARAYAKYSGCTYSSMFLRLGGRQQKGADRLRRHQQLHGSLVLKRPEQVSGTRVILIDDVITTGATMEEAARVLKAAGARAVACLAYARA
jgi:ComF family protein